MDKFAVTDLDRLHRVVEKMNDPSVCMERGEGVTFAQCHELAGVMETTNSEGVFCRVATFSDARHILRMLMLQVLPDHGIIPLGTWRNFNVKFALPNGVIKHTLFVIRDEENEQYQMRGRDWPVVDFYGE